MGHPDAELVAAERRQHDAVVLRDLEREEGALKLMRCVMQHLRAVGVLGVDKTQLHHELTAVADAERESVLTGIELVESLLCLRVEEEGTSPSLS